LGRRNGRPNLILDYEDLQFEQEKAEDPLIGGPSIACHAISSCTLHRRSSDLGGIWHRVSEEQLTTGVRKG